MRLQGKTAIITGAGSGIGQATAQLFASEGASVLAVDRPQSAILAVHQGVEGVTPFAMDITDDGAPDAIVSAAVSAFGGLDIIMNNAGTGSNALAEILPIDEWDRVINVNLRATFLLCQRAIPELRARGKGRIINVASVMATRTDYGLAAYCASKAGVAGLTHTLALELGKWGITANYILPGPIYTGMTRQSFDKDFIKQVWEKKTAVRRLGQPIDIARGALFLASDDSDYVTGHGLTIDGGLTLRS